MMEMIPMSFYNKEFSFEMDTIKPLATFDPIFSLFKGWGCGELEIIV